MMGGANWDTPTYLLHPLTTPLPPSPTPPAPPPRSSGWCCSRSLGGGGPQEHSTKRRRRSSGCVRQSCPCVCVSVCLPVRLACSSPSGITMTGQPLQLAQRAVQRLLTLLHPADRVNVITVRGGGSRDLACAAHNPTFSCRWARWLSSCHAPPTGHTYHVRLRPCGLSCVSRWPGWWRPRTSLTTAQQSSWHWEHSMSVSMQPPCLARPHHPLPLP